MLGRDGGLSLSPPCHRRYDARVTSPRRLWPLGLAAALVLAGCAAATSPSLSPAGPPTSAPNLTPVPGGPSAPAPASAMTTSNVEGFGAIWDAVPPSFPKLPGAIPADESKPASGLYASIIGDAPTATDTMTRALRAKGWTVDAGSPLEDGTIVLEATGAPAGCKAEIRFTPVSGSLIMEVLVGASCPFS